MLWRGKLGGQAVLVAGTEPPDVTELWDWTLGPGESHSSPAHAAGTRELLLVLDGQVELRAGQHAEVLATGDSASFAGDLPHGYVERQHRAGGAVRPDGVRAGRGPGITIGGYRWLIRACSRSSSAGACVDAAVFALRPDYRVLLLAVDGLVPGPGDQDSDALLQAAEAAAREALGGGPAGAAPARGGVAGGLPGVRGQAAAHPQQPGGAAAPAPRPGCPG